VRTNARKLNSGQITDTQSFCYRLFKASNRKKVTTAFFQPTGNRYCAKAISALITAIRVQLSPNFFCIFEKLWLMASEVIYLLENVFTTCFMSPSFGLRPGFSFPVRVGLGVFSGIAHAFPNFDAPSILPF